MVEFLEQELLPKVFQRTVTSLLKNKRTFKPDFLKQIETLYLLAEEAKQTVIERFSRPGVGQEDIACHKGCHHCCGMVVKPTMPELYLIFEHIRQTYSKAGIDKLIHDLRQHAAFCDRSKTVDERVKIHCALLQDGICSIEPVKPLSCRAYTSTDVEKCKQFVQSPTIEVPTSICHYSPFDITRKAIMKSLYIAGFKDITEELNAGILRLLEGEYGEMAAVGNREDGQSHSDVIF